MMDFTYKDSSLTLYNACDEHDENMGKRVETLFVLIKFYWMTVLDHIDNDKHGNLNDIGINMRFIFYIFLLTTVMAWCDE